MTKTVKLTQRTKKEYGWHAEASTDLGVSGMHTGGSSQILTDLLSRGTTGLGSVVCAGCNGTTTGFSTGGLMFFSPVFSLKLLFGSISMDTVSSLLGVDFSSGLSTGNFSRRRFWTCPLFTTEYTEISHSSKKYPFFMSYEYLVL